MHLFGQPSRGGRIGVISDTHSLLRPEALEVLEGVDCILHAGDIGDPAHLDALVRIAPVTAVAAISTAASGPRPCRKR